MKKPDPNLGKVQILCKGKITFETPEVAKIMKNHYGATEVEVFNKPKPLKINPPVITYPPLKVEEVKPVDITPKSVKPQPIDIPSKFIGEKPKEKIDPETEKSVKEFFDATHKPLVDSIKEVHEKINKVKQPRKSKKDVKGN